MSLGAKQLEFPMVRRGKHAAAWERFHAANPQVAEGLRDLALELRGAGVARWSIRDLFAVLRHTRAVQTRGSAFKLNNSLAAYYARHLAATVPALAGFFETRESEADRV